MKKKFVGLFLSIMVMSSFVLGSGLPDNAKKTLQKLVAAHATTPLSSPKLGPMSPMSPRISRMSGRAEVTSQVAMCKHLGDECDCFVISEIKKTIEGNKSQKSGILESLSPKLLLLKKASKNLK